jgi:hypothetical protein
MRRANAKFLALIAGYHQCIAWLKAVGLLSAIVIQQRWNNLLEDNSFTPKKLLDFENNSL